MYYTVVVTKSAQKDVTKLDKQVALRIQKKIQFFIESDKPLHFAEHLTEPKDAQYRWRVGDFRILFDEQNKIITILKIQHRREVYKK